MKNKDKTKNKSKKYNENDKSTSMASDMETGALGANNESNDFVPNLQKWTTSDEQKAKTRQIQKKTER